jgi:hypothetical protein
MASKKISGITEDKVQFFSKAYGLDDVHSIAKNITDPSYRGDFIFCSNPSQTQGEGDIPKWSDKTPLSANARLDLPYTITRFDSNHLNIRVSNDHPIWLLYSDVWHPLWRAMVNNQPKQIFKANLAYKAISLDPGENNIQFYFKSELLAFFQSVINLNSLFWVGMVMVLIGKILCF